MLVGELFATRTAEGTGRLRPIDIDSLPYIKAKNKTFNTLRLHNLSLAFELYKSGLTASFSKR